MMPNGPMPPAPRALKMRVIKGAILGALLLGSGFALSMNGNYGWTLFALVPVLGGALGTWVARPKSAAKAMKFGMLVNLAGSFLFLALGVEGLICVAMTLPLAIPLGALGGWLAYVPRRTGSPAAGTVMLALLPLSLGTLGYDSTAKPDVFEVRSSIEIAAAPEQVWKHVVTFSELPPPEEWYFRAGIAYPMRARIEGSGPEAVRYCEFSTGPFVEPIRVWDEPRLLQFDVTSNPAPMHELSPYGDLLPKHLHGYLISKRGQFLLTPMANGHTRLEGTTWYEHRLWPEQYWCVWSDAIIHRIHLRVLNHIKNLAEAETDARARTNGPVLARGVVPSGAE